MLTVVSSMSDSSALTSSFHWPFRGMLQLWAEKWLGPAGRDLHRRRRLAARFERPTYEPDPARAISVEALLTGLDPERRLACVVTQVLGLSYQEAAEICDCPVGTIRSRVARARADLLVRLGEATV